MSILVKFSEEQSRNIEKATYWGLLSDNEVELTMLLTVLVNQISDLQERLQKLESKFR